MQAFVEGQLQSQNLSAGLLMQLGLVTEEIFVNIAQYAYGGGAGDVEVGVQVSPQPPMVTLRFADRGVPFDPLARPRADVTLPAQDRPIGGLGIFLALKMMDRADYRYQDGQNILTLQKML